MESLLLHHLGAPCVAQIREQEQGLFKERVKFYVNPEAVIRFEPGGAVVTPPTLYASFLHLDQEAADLLRGSSFSGHGLPKAVINSLEENQVILRGVPARIKGKVLRVQVAGLPTQVLFDVTAACNCDCLACYHKDDLDGYVPTTKDLISRIDHLVNLGLSIFEVTGGEPFLRDDLGQILARITETGALYYVVTNGEFLESASQEMLGMLSQSLGLAVSLDGVAEVHDHIRRRPGLFKKLERGLAIVQNAGIPVYLISTLNRENVADFSAMVQFASRFGTTVHARPTIRTGNALAHDLGHIDVFAAIKDHLGHPNVRNGLLSTKKTIPQAQYYGCGIRKRISVSAYGDLFPCVMDRSRKLGNIEDYTQESLVKALVAETNRFLEARPGCLICQENKDKMNPICGGFCRFSNSYQVKHE